MMTAQEILSELGIDQYSAQHKRQGYVFSQLSDGQKEALQVARQANDRNAVRAIFTEAGF